MAKKIVLFLLSVFLIFSAKPASAINTSLQKSGNPLVTCAFLNGRTVGSTDNRCVFQIAEVSSTSLSQIFITDGSGPVNVAYGDLIQVVLSVRDNTLPPGIYHRFAQIDSPGYQLLSIDGFNFIGGSTTSYTNTPGSPVSGYTLNSLSSEFLTLTYRCADSNGCSGLVLGKTGGVFLSFQVGASDTGVTIQVVSLNYLGLVDDESQSDVADKELEGQDNIQNQDTTGDDQGISDDDYSSLLDIFTGFVTSIGGVSATNCNLSMDTGLVDFGDVDLCQLDPPSWVQIVGSIMALMLFVPLSLALVKRILNTIQELQQ